MQLRPATVIHGRYRIVRLIGAGGFGTVYEAIDERLDHRVALKQLMRVNERLSKQFTNEARLLANLYHPALPRVTDHFSEADSPFLVMDYIPGEDLGTMLHERNAPFPVDDVLGLGYHLLDVLHYLHSRQPPIIHRDIKPQNLKRRADGGIILLDFGLAKGYAGEVLPPSTASSIAASTRGFAPPEQVEGTGTDARSDLYALSATLYCLLTNTALPEAQTRQLAALRGKPDPLRLAHERNPLVPKAISQVLAQAMALEMDERPADALAMRALLDAARTGLGATFQPTEVALTLWASATEMEHEPTSVQSEGRPTSSADKYVPDATPIQGRPASSAGHHVPVATPIQGTVQDTKQGKTARRWWLWAVAATAGAVIATLAIMFVVQAWIEPTPPSPNGAIAGTSVPTLVAGSGVDSSPTSILIAPTASETVSPSATPMPTATSTPTTVPTSVPIPTSTLEPTAIPTIIPTPTLVPTPLPTQTLVPTAVIVVPDPSDEAASVVLSYYDAINRRDYAAAYNFWGDEFQQGESYETFAAGFEQTERDEVVIKSVEQTGSEQYAIDIELTAFQTDGSVMYFVGIYYVGKEGGSWKILSSLIS